MVQNPSLVGGPGVPKVASEPSLYMVLRAIWLVALVFQKVAPEPPPWPVGVLVVARGSMGWCSKSWGGVPKSCPRIPTQYTTPAHNFVVGPVSGVVRYKNLVFPSVCMVPLRRYLTQGTSGGISVLWTHFFSSCFFFFFFLQLAILQNF